MRLQGAVPMTRRILRRTSVFLLITLGAFCLLIMFTGDWLMVLAFGEVGRETGAVLEALALSMLISGAGLVAGCGLWAYRRTCGELPCGRDLLGRDACRGFLDRTVWRFVLQSLT